MQFAIPKQINEHIVVITTDAEGGGGIGGVLRDTADPHCKLYFALELTT